ARVGTLVPQSSRESVGSFFREYDTLLARYLRGQLVEAALVGILTWLGLWVLGFPYAGLVGVVAGVFNMVPYLGLAVSLIPAIIIALLSGNVLVSLLKVVVVFVVVQALDGSVTGPKIVGGAIGLHPVWVILALAMGGAFFGFVGLLIAMPAAIFLKLLLQRGIERYQASRLYLGGAEEGAG
ncbi:MAG: AI-2E family transporter, partial [Gemmatimonadota bacterium]